MNVHLALPPRTFFCEEPGEGYLVIIYFINSVIYFNSVIISDFFSCEDTREGYQYLVMCGFLENNKCLRVGTPAIVALFLLQTYPSSPSEKGNVMWPSQQIVWGPLIWT